MENGSIPDGKIMASSMRDNDRKPSFARLRGEKAWCSGKEESPYLQISLGEAYYITGIATQGSSTDLMWVTEYEIRYTTNTAGWDVHKVTKKTNQDTVES